MVADLFGADDEQVARDHLLSHLLAVLSQAASQQVVFFGGTALGRAYLVNSRLSEDLDLIAVRDRRDVASMLELQHVRGVRREYPGLRWARTLTEVKDTLGGGARCTSRSGGSHTVAEPRWPGRLADEDAQSRAALFRGLLAAEGAMDDEAAQLYARFGPTGTVPASHIFRDAPAETSWHRELANQTRLTITAAQALQHVRAAWSHLDAR